MSVRRIIHSLILLLAVWSPLNSAIAGAALVGCPLNMAHTLEQGLDRGLSHSTVDRQQHAVSQAADNVCGFHTSSAQSGSDDSCHCTFCLLLGASALPGSVSNTPAFGTTVSHTAIPQAPAVGYNSTPFRPPINRLV